MKVDEIINELWDDWRQNTRMKIGLCSVQTIRSIFELAIKRYIDYMKSSKPQIENKTKRKFHNPDLQLIKKNE